MTLANVSDEELVRDFADIGSRHLFPNEDYDQANCLSDQHLVELAKQGLDQLSNEDRDHLIRCPRCAHTYSRLRSVFVTVNLPDRWHAMLSCDEDEQVVEDGRACVIGRISLETLQFQATLDDSEWISHPLYLRVNIVVDPEMGLFSVTILDVPTEIAAGYIQGPMGWMRLDADESAQTFELDEFYEIDDIPNESFRSIDAFLKYVQHGRLRVRFESSHTKINEQQFQEDIGDLLFRLSAIERDAPYWLPNKLRTDTHVNAGKLCRHEFAIQRIASEFDACFATKKFDYILAHGWAMGTISRQLAKMRGGYGKPPEDIMSFGYDPPLLMADIIPDSQVLVLIDVVVTGGLIRDLKRLVANAGASVAGIGAVVSARADEIPASRGVRSLCQIDMKLDAGAKDYRSIAPSDEWVWNPFSCTMTKRLREARTPSEFLNENKEAEEFWDLVDKVDAYYVHHKERKSHYIAFIDTKKMLQHEDVGEKLVTDFAARVSSNFPTPDVLFVPGRRDRGKMLGNALLQRLSRGRKKKPKLVVASWGRHGWKIRPNDQLKFCGSRVLVVDTAIGHGKTIEQLCSLASAHRPAGLGAAVLISRIAEAGEVALDYRLSDGFLSLYHLPIQPFVIRGERNDLCPICAEKAAVKAAMEEWGTELFEQWQKWLSRHPVTRSDDSATNKAKGERSQQLGLFPSDTHSFFRRCRPKTAGAVTLHSVNAAKMNGMASLALSELIDSDVEPLVKRAMLEHLPPRVLEWSGESLERDLEQVLATSDKTSVVRAAARVFSREDYGQWFEYLGEALRRCRALRSDPSPVFWGSMIWNAYVTGQNNRDAAARLQEQLGELLDDYRDSAAGPGIERMLKATSCRTHDDESQIVPTVERVG